MKRGTGSSAARSAAKVLIRNESPASQLDFVDNFRKACIFLGRFVSLASPKGVSSYVVSSN